MKRSKGGREKLEKPWLTRPRHQHLGKSKTKQRRIGRGQGSKEREVLSISKAA